MAGQIGGNPHFRTGQVSVATSATMVVAEDAERLMLHVSNPSDTTIYIGAAGVTPATGYPVFGPSAVSVSTRDAVYAVVAAGAASLAYFEEHS